MGKSFSIFGIRSRKNEEHPISDLLDRRNEHAHTLLIRSSALKIDTKIERKMGREGQFFEDGIIIFLKDGAEVLRSYDSGLTDNPFSIFDIRSRKNEEHPISDLLDRRNEYTHPLLLLPNPLWLLFLRAHSVSLHHLRDSDERLTYS